MNRPITKVLVLFSISLAMRNAYSMEGAIEHGISYFGNQDAFFTLNPKVKISGPVYDFEGSEADYIQSLFKLIIKKGHAIAKGYRDEGHWGAYYSFLLGSMVVPYHEGHLIHFISYNPIGDRCSLKSNTGEWLKDKRTGDKPLNPYQTFTKYLREVKPMVAPDCSEIAPDKKATQYLGSLDRLSSGMMQIVMHWHIEDYIALNKHLSVADTIEYGLQYYYSGFNHVLRNAVPDKKYGCVYLKGTTKIDYFDLIRGVWAGKYNNGSDAYTCRIYNTPAVNKDTKLRDKDFKTDLERFTLKKDNMFLTHLRGVELAAYQEIMDGFQSAVTGESPNQKPENLDQIIK